MTRYSAGFLIVLLLFGSTAAAQRFGRRGPRVNVATPENFDGAFHFCRLAYQGSGWSTDYPRADYNFSIRFSELTKAWVGMDADGEPLPLIVRPTDDTLFQCPFVMIWHAHTLRFSSEDAARMRAYLLKGGFLWSDDLWGSYAWENLSNEMAQVFPPAQYPWVDIPPDHPMFRTLFEVKGGVPQTPAINYWMRSGGDTSEQGADSAHVYVKGIYDKAGRLMVLSTHNTDIADGWEREGDDPQYFYKFSVTSYAIGIDMFLYAMTH
jgi:hypothetical protein